jgi:hypothetical protein
MAEAAFQHSAHRDRRARRARYLARVRAEGRQLGIAAEILAAPGTIPTPRATRSSTPSSTRSTRRAIGVKTEIVPDHEPVLVDTDVASALYLERYYDRRVSVSLAGSLATRRLAISLITLGEAYYRRHFEPLSTFGLTLV